LSRATGAARVGPARTDRMEKVMIPTRMLDMLVWCK
jgi:hypothetical protein